MEEKLIPKWLTELNEEDFQFIKRFLLASGSLKDVAAQYGISYPTVRLRLDRLIEKIRLLDDVRERDSFQTKIQVFVADGLLSPMVARTLLREYAKIIKGRNKNG